jgi:hypothetical protein
LQLRATLAAEGHDNVVWKNWVLDLLVLQKRCGSLVAQSQQIGATTKRISKQSFIARHPMPARGANQSIEAMPADQRRPTLGKDHRMIRRLGAGLPSWCRQISL